MISFGGHVENKTITLIQFNVKASSVNSDFFLCCALWKLKNRLQDRNVQLKRLGLYLLRMHVVRVPDGLMDLVTNLR